MPFTRSQMRYLFLKMECIEKEVKLFQFLRKYPFMNQYLNDTPGCHFPPVHKNTTLKEFVENIIDSDESSDESGYDFEDQYTCQMSEDTHSYNEFEDIVDDNDDLYEFLKDIFFDTNDEKISDQDVYEFLLETFDMKKNEY